MSKMNRSSDRRIRALISVSEDIKITLLKIMFCLYAFVFLVLIVNYIIENWK